jgi:uncharacterized protein
MNFLPSITHLISAGARLNDVNDDGLSPLMWAAWNGQDTIVDCLLEHGASPHLKDRRGKCALDYSKSKTVHQRISGEMIKISVEKKFT